MDTDAQRLGSELAARLPRVELTELLLEVDAWTQFSAHLTRAAGAPPQAWATERYLGDER